MTQDLRAAVRDAYSRAASHPGEKHPFPAGAALAESLGYARPLLTDYPSAAEAFAGVSCVPAFAGLDARMTVLDLGCGAGLDSIAVAPRVRKVIGLDFSAEMLARAALHTDAVQGEAERLPFAAASFDAVLANGIFNLNPRRQEIFSEIARVLRPGGCAWGAELILQAPLDEEARSRANWFA
jgi:SAM-dependent methyltransferase